MNIIREREKFVQTANEFLHEMIVREDDRGCAALQSILTRPLSFYQIADECRTQTMLRYGGETHTAFQLLHEEAERIAKAIP